MKLTTLILIIVATLIIQPYLPIAFQEILYALSLTIKEIFLFILPLIIFTFLFRMILELHIKAIGLLLILLILITSSNFITIILSYFISATFLPVVATQSITTDALHLRPYWLIEFPKLISNNLAILLSVVTGVISMYTIPREANKLSHTLISLSNFFLNKVMTPIIPIFIIGFITKMGFEKATFSVFKNYSYILFIITASCILYTCLWYLILTGRRFWIVLANMVPAVVTGFSTMSSAVAMPFLIVATEKNVGKSTILPTVIPSISSFHMVSDCLLLSVLSLGIYNTFYGFMPDFAHYLQLTVYLIIARFAMAGVPGGGAFVILPILKEHFEFTDEMGALLMTVYLIFDCVNTALNIFANGAFIIGFKTFYNKISQKPI